MEEASKIKFDGKKRIVLWTAKQIEILKLVVDHLMNPNQTGSLPLIVDGCKGSGKTMLLLFFAKIAHQVLLLRADQEDKEDLCADQEDKENLCADQEDKVLVCNAHFLFATELTLLLKNSLSTCGVSVFDPTGEIKKIKLRALNMQKMKEGKNTPKKNC